MVWKDGENWGRAASTCAGGTATDKACPYYYSIVFSANYT